MNILKRRPASLWAVVVLLVGCGSSAPPPSSKGIGPAGGTVTSAEGARVVIPPGALSSSVDVQVTKDGTGAAALPAVADLVAVGDVFALTPHGTTFSKPVTLTLPFDPARVPSGARIMLFKNGFQQTGWTQVSGATVSGSTITGEISGFSFPLVVAVLPPLIVAQPQDQTVSPGQTATFSVSAVPQTGGTLSYAWESSRDQGATWTPIAGASQGTYTTPAAAAGDNGIRFRAIVALAGVPGSDTTSDAALLGVSSPGGVIQVSAGWHHGLAVKSDGSVWAWGRNDQHQLGDGTTAANRLSAVQVPGLPAITRVSAGHYHSLALASDGSVWAWGAPLPAAGAATQLVPVKVALTGRFVDIAASDGFSVALRDDGTVWAWGLNNSGELGRGTNGGGTQDSTPAQVLVVSGIGAISVARSHTLALKSDGTVWAWGSNSFGQLGDGTPTLRSTPFEVPGLSGISDLLTAFGRSYARKKDAQGNVTTAFAWGGTVFTAGVAQFAGALTPTALAATAKLYTDVLGRSSPILISDGVSNAAGSDTFLLVIDAGSVLANGANADGVLGNGTTTDRSTPAANGFNQAVILSTSGRWVLALRSDGTVWAWGYNQDGELGDGTFINRPSPVKVQGL